MQKTSALRSTFFSILFTGAMILQLLFLGGCGGGSDGGAPLVSANVSAADGGTFTDGSSPPEFKMTILPGTLSADARLQVDVVGVPRVLDANQSAASRAFSVQLTSAQGPLTLSEPMILELRADPAPLHPQLGEVAQLNGTVWQRLEANFFRSADSTVVALAFEPEGTFGVVHRSLQRASGDGVAAGFDVFLSETFGNEAFFGGVLELHTLLNGVAPADAVALGVQVDLNKVPQPIVDVMIGSDLNAKDAALNDPAITRRLIKSGAVIGVKGIYNSDDPADDVMIQAGITCALCHLNVQENTFELLGGPTALPIGQQMIDGVPNTRMDAGAILALTPFAVNAGQQTQDLLNSWGPGRFDIRALPDNPLEDDDNNPTSYPPLWNFIDLSSRLTCWDGTGCLTTTA